MGSYHTKLAGLLAGRQRHGGRDGAPGPLSATHTGLALAVVMTGVLITAVDTTIVILALPEIERDLHVALASVIWIVIGYLLATTLLATQVGRLGDMFGRVRMYETGFVVFILGSGLCALSWNEAAIIGFRVLQGIGGALVTANSGAVIADLFPPERRGKAYGYNAIGYSLGAVLGIVLGGLIVTYISWRWVFWINVPIGLGAVVLALRVLHDHGEREHHRIDLTGMACLGLGLFGILWGVTKLATAPLDASLVGFFAGGVVLILAFVWVERVQAEPMLDLKLFRIPSMSPSLLASLFQGLANYAVLFLVIMYLQGPRGLSPIHASLLLVPGYMIGGSVGPISGRLADKLGPVVPATAGLAIQVIALFIYAHLTGGTGLWLVVVASTINGIGSSSFFPANTSAVMKASPPETFGITSGALRTFANIGMVFSFSMAILIASRSISRGLAFAIFVGSTSLHGRAAAAFTSGLHSAFYASMGMMAVAALLSASRGTRRLGAGKPAPGAASEAASAMGHFGMRELPTRVRIVCLDPNGAILLMKWRDPVDRRVFWEPPGGGIEQGESSRQAAARELREETGLEVEISSWSVLVDRDYRWAGRRHRHVEELFCADVPSDGVRLAMPTEEEAATFVEWRFFDLAHLEHLDAPLEPPTLRALVGQLAREPAS